MKKRIGIIALLVYISAGIVSGQEYKLGVQNSKDVKLILKDFSGTLPIEGYSGSEIIITSNSGALVPPERAKGLKPVFPAGTDNTGIGLDVQKTDNVITVTCLLPFSRKAEYKMKLPENMSIEISSGCERSNSVEITGMKNEIEIETCHGIDLKNVTGPLVLSSISGDINVSFSNVNTTRASSINCVSGDVDITLPAKVATNLYLGTVTGTFYSDFDFPQTGKDLKRVGGNELNYPLNGGGFKFSIETISGNIYLRKGN
jgi:hypothetical protein